MGSKNSLIEKLTRGDNTSEKYIFEHFNSRLFTFFKFRIKGEDNYEDLVQEVFVSFFDAINKNKIKEDIFIAPFIFGIAKRIIFNYFYKKNRKEKIKKKAEFENRHFYNFSEEERMENESILNIVNSKIGELKEIDRIIIKNYFMLEKSLDEISDITGKPKHYISVRKERVLKKLKIEIFKDKHLFSK